MFVIYSGKSKSLCCVSSLQPRSAGTQVLFLGLDGAGKTSLLHCFATGSLEQDVSPTEGFNAISVNKEELQIEFLESKYKTCILLGIMFVCVDLMHLFIKSHINLLMFY